MEKLYNGILLPDVWPPRDADDRTDAELRVPWLEHPPEVVEIDVGRQLLVDDFLIEDSRLERRFHAAVFTEDSPVLRPETPLEMNGGEAPVAGPFTDGCWYDPENRLYRLYYHAGWFDGTALAVSPDGRHFTRKLLPHELGTNRVLPVRKGWRRDGACLWLDLEAEDPERRWKLFQYSRTPGEDVGEVFTSRDGVTFSSPTVTSPCGDNTSFFRNPFRKKWVFSVRTALPAVPWYCRGRSYVEMDHFPTEAPWPTEDLVFWQRCDARDCRECEPGTQYSRHLPPQLYHLNCVAYESVMLGLFGILKGFDEAHNAVNEGNGIPKIIDLYAGFSRDGFHFSRENRTPFLRCTRTPGDWNRGYLHACGGLCMVTPEKLLFPVAGFSGESPRYGGNLYAGASTGLAELRRDGFASLHANGTRQTVLTRPLRFTQGRFLFINADASRGMLEAQIEDTQGRALPGYAFENCHVFLADSTKAMLRFDGGDLSALRGQPVRIRFRLISADLYSFWVSPEPEGYSHGYVAAGGPAYPSMRDIPAGMV